MRFMTEVTLGLTQEEVLAAAAPSSCGSNHRSAGIVWEMVRN
jgi:hypothetical protein